MIAPFCCFGQLENTWTKKQVFGGGKRERAVAFSIGDFGYIGTGVNTLDTVLNDFGNTILQTTHGHKLQIYRVLREETLLDFQLGIMVIVEWESITMKHLMVINFMIFTNTILH
jgi:hypothetical protein